MKLKLLNAALSTLVLGVFVGQARADLVVEYAESTDWAGPWAGLETVISVNDYGAGIIVIHGIDAGSSFTCTGLRLEQVVNCAGSGLQHVGNKVYAYSGRFELHPDGALSETWEAVWESDGKAFPRNGKNRYQRGFRAPSVPGGQGSR